MTLRSLVTGVLLSCGFLAGCATDPSVKVASRAAFDMDCEPKQIAVTPGDGCTYYARGCGKKAVYIVQPKAAGSMVCCPPIGCEAILNSAVRDDSSGSE